MSDAEKKQEEVKKEVGGDKDYVAALTKMKAERDARPTQEALDQALAEKKKLLDALVNGGQVKQDQGDEIEKAREMMKKGCTNLDYVKSSLKLRQAALDAGEPDPYESHVDGKQAVDGTKVANALQDLVERSSSPQVFNALLDNAMVNDKVGGLAGGKR